MERKVLSTARWQFPVLYEDEAVLCLDKPAGIAVESERWNKQASNLIDELKSIESLAYRPRLVHRLDKGTSGVIAIAKDQEAERSLRMQFEHRTVSKEYFALVDGEVPGEGGEIDLKIGPDPKKEGRMQIDRKNGDEAYTAYRVLECFRGFTALSAFPKTGRTHQIRVHLASRGFSLLVDELYGRRKSFFLSEFKFNYRLGKGQVERPLISRLSLHAQSLSFQSPAVKDPVVVQAPLAHDLHLVSEKLRKFAPLN